MRSLSVVLALGACVCLTGTAQEPKTQPKPADKAPAKADKPDKAELVPGRKTKKIEGFTFLISEEALKADASVYERPPLAVLEYECQRLSKALSPKAVDLLRRLTVFVDWDEQVPFSNGRPGNSLATYYGGSPQQQTKEGRHPLQSKTVTIHALKTLTQQRQPKSDARSSALLLHEFAHAVHDQLLGFDHAGIKAAYEQAMERRLVEKDSYAATNVREFFAEMSRAYLDRLSYYPYTRADLKKHDPVTFKTMESVWAGAAAPRPDADAEKPDLSANFPADVRFGPHLAGPAVATDKLAGKHVLIGFWGVSTVNVLDRLERIGAELGDYGVVVVSASGAIQTDEAIKAKAEDRAPRVSAVRNALVRSGETGKSPPSGTALLFDPKGKCVYRGSAYDAEEAVRAAVGKALLRTAVGSDEVPAAFKPVADAFASGVAPVAVYPKVVPLLNSADADTKTAAKALADLILAPGEKALADAQAKTKADPVEAFFGAEQVATGFKGTALEKKAGALLGTLRTDKAVAAELKARTMAAEVEKLAGKLRAQDGSFNPSDPKFQAKHQPALAQLKAQLDQLRKVYPNARATAAAEKAARELGVN